MQIHHLRIHIDLARFLLVGREVFRSVENFWPVENSFLSVKNFFGSWEFFCRSRIFWPVENSFCRSRIFWVVENYFLSYSMQSIWYVPRQGSDTHTLPKGNAWCNPNRELICPWCCTKTQSLLQVYSRRRSKQIYLEKNNTKPREWKRYIDDVFSLWDCNIWSGSFHWTS